MSFAMKPEIVTLAWIDSAFVQFPLNIYATKGLALQGAAGRRPALHGTRLCEPQQAGRKGSSPQAQIRKFPCGPLRVADPRSAFRDLAVGGSIKMRPSFRS